MLTPDLFLTGFTSLMILTTILLAVTGGLLFLVDLKRRRSPLREPEYAETAFGTFVLEESPGLPEDEWTWSGEVDSEFGPLTAHVPNHHGYPDPTALSRIPAIVAGMPHWEARARQACHLGKQHELYGFHCLDGQESVELIFNDTRAGGRSVFVTLDKGKVTDSVAIA